MANRRTHNLRAVLAGSAFRRLLGVRLGGQFTDGVFQAALAGSVLFNPDRQATPTAIALAAAVLVLPYSLVGPFAGVLLDRWSRRSVIWWTNLARAVLALPIAALVLVGDEGGLFLTGTLVVIGLGRLLLSGLSAATPHVVAADRLVTANAVAGTAGSVAYSLGMGVALALLGRVFPAGDHGYGALALLAPVGYVACAVLARAFFARDQLGPDEVVPHRPGVSGETAAVLRGMVDGIRHLGAARGAAYAMGAQAGFRVLFGALALALLLLYRSVFGADNLTGVSTQLGLVFAAGALGVLVAATATPWASRRVGGWRWVAGLLAAVAVAVPVFGLPFSPPLLVLLVLVVNVAGHGVKIVVDTMVQHECADVFRGRVFAVNDTVFNLAYVVGMVGASRFLPVDGRSAGLLFAAAVGYALLAGGYAMAAGRWARRVGDDIADPGRAVALTGR
ncbi:MFS transporter [Micromonospora sp. NPDC050686]|uniref:MFS transporter n=1 Tax=Micromonospora sp. NPDC050686 TaxID=3154631 RepID=UPI0033E12E87